MDLDKRLIQHNSSHPDDLQVLYILEVDYIDEVEGCVKQILKSYQYRKKKEFYKIDLDTIKQVINDCDKITIKKETKPSEQ